MTGMVNRTGRTVYSTHTGDLRKQAPAGPAIHSLPAYQQTARLALDKRQRRGKRVTLISGLVLAEADMEALAKALKTRCGSGGTVKDGHIEIQGDHRDVVQAELEALGYHVKRVGG